MFTSRLFPPCFQTQPSESMESKFVIPEDAINSIRCSLCDNYLSVPPIMVISEDGKENQCGRCQQIKCRAYMRNVYFENIARFLSFPCTFKNCEERLPWGKVEEHEEVCPYRTIRCPLYYRICNDVIEVTKLEAHFIQCHGTNIKYGNMVKELIVGRHDVFLLIVDNTQFLVNIYTTDDFSVGVFSVAPLDKYKKYDLKLTSSKCSRLSVFYEKQKIVHYNERQHCFKCSVNKCTLEHHPYSIPYAEVNENADKTITKFRKDHILGLLQTPESVIFSINVIPDESVEVETEEPTPKEIMSQNNSILFRKNFECPICKEYMLGPIYNCLTGHTICVSCKPQLEKCPSCQAEFSDSRNFSLESLMENVEVPCQNEAAGCKFAGNIEKISRHEGNCPYKY
ncbi:hypothetical protein NQ318_001908 [Aromia moschata]|uniref:RING-type domain-containing protein n=1 Tax=Aromia moschata TaxID=1265417 RepID=A0AAV8Z171_9CUCU|nr:hypothetical protein NQ318_001908 [Aromia moschata]